MENVAAAIAPKRFSIDFWHEIFSFLHGKMEPPVGIAPTSQLYESRASLFMLREPRFLTQKAFRVVGSENPLARDKPCFYW